MVIPLKLEVKFYQTIQRYLFSQLLPRQQRQKCLLAFLMPDRIDILQVHRITAVALHLRVFQGIVIFLREALWIKSIEESNDNITNYVNRLT